MKSREREIRERMKWGKRNTKMEAERITAQKGKEKKC